MSRIAQRTWTVGRRVSVDEGRWSLLSRNERSGFAAARMSQTGQRPVAVPGSLRPCQNEMAIELDSTRIENASCIIASAFRR